MVGNDVGYAARRREKRASRGEVARMAKVYDSAEKSRFEQGRRADYRRCLIWTVHDPELTLMNLPGIYIEESGGRRPVYLNPMKGREGTYVLKNPSQNGTRE